jgi:streptomycin 6-kinase
MEWLEGKSLGDMVRRGQDQQATIELIEVANTIHQDRSGYSDDLPHLEEWYEDVFNLKFAMMFRKV